MNISIDIMNITLEFLWEIRMTCQHCGFVGGTKWFVDGDDNCVECRDFIQGNGFNEE